VVRELQLAIRFWQLPMPDWKFQNSMLVRGANGAEIIKKLKLPKNKAKQCLSSNY
jgi:hypothetical protein